MNQSINQSMNQSINQSMNQLINQWMNQSINQWINQSMNQLINEWINESETETIKRQDEVQQADICCDLQLAYGRNIRGGEFSRGNVRGISGGIVRWEWPRGKSREYPGGMSEKIVRVGNFRGNGNLVNRQAHRQLLTGYTISSVSWAKMLTKWYIGNEQFSTSVDCRRRSRRVPHQVRKEMDEETSNFAGRLPSGRTPRRLSSSFYIRSNLITARALQI